MGKGARVLRNSQIIDKFAPDVFMSTIRCDKTRELLDIAIGCMEPERDYVFTLHQDEQEDDSHVMITNTLSFKPAGTCKNLANHQGCTEFVCSECGTHYLGFRFKYCPGCGAKVVEG